MFCSRECYGIFCRKEVSCIVCGKMILAGLNKKTCSRACSNINRTGTKYKTGIFKKDKVKTYRHLKMRLMNIRGKTCQKCGYAKDKILQVHHIDENRNNNDLDNLQLLCPNCHFEHHLL